MRAAVCGLCLAALLWVSVLPARTEVDHAVILIYHHVSTETPASTSVSPDQFERHLDYIESAGYRVWPLSRVLAAIYDDAEALPEDVVAITFDDAYESVFSEARPRLDSRGLPYSVFVNTDAIDAGHSPYMTWDQLRRLSDEGVELGNHSATHGHLAAPESEESQADWRHRVAEDIGKAHDRITREIGRAPEAFAYPYGEDSPELAEIVGERYRWGLAQRSGPIGPLTDPLSMPRFPMATGFASMDRLELALRSRPLPVVQVRTRADGRKGGLERIRLILEEGGYRSGQIGCFSGSGQSLSIERERADPLVISIDVEGVGRPGRNKVNCTAPASDGSGDFFWYAYQWKVAS